MPFSALLAVGIAVVVAAGLLYIMVTTSRPENGWKGTATDLFRRDGEKAPGVLAEAREVTHADGVSIEALLSEAEPDSGYYAVPKRYEDRIEAVAVAVANRVDKARTRKAGEVSTDD